MDICLRCELASELFKYSNSKSALNQAKEYFLEVFANSFSFSIRVNSSTLASASNFSLSIFFFKSTEGFV